MGSPHTAPGLSQLMDEEKEQGSNLNFLNKMSCTALCLHISFSRSQRANSGSSRCAAEGWLSNQTATCIISASILHNSMAFSIHSNAYVLWALLIATEEYYLPTNHFSFLLNGKYIFRASNISTGTMVAKFEVNNNWKTLATSLVFLHACRNISWNKWAFFILSKR